MGNFSICYDGVFAAPTLAIVAYLIVSKTGFFIIQSSECSRMGVTS